MIDLDTLSRATTEESKERNKLVDKMLSEKEGLNEAKERLANHKAQANWLNERIRYCKNSIPNDKAIFAPMRKEVWCHPNLWDPATDFSMGAKAYAYLLYYRQQMNGLQKHIKNLKAEVHFRNLQLSQRQKMLREYDDMLKEKYKPDWRPCRFVIDTDQEVLGERDCNPNLTKKFFRKYDEWMNWLHTYREDQVLRYEDVE